MANEKEAFKITVTKKDFVEKSPEEQNWILLQGILYMHERGCDYGRNGCKQEAWRKISVLGAAIGGGLSIGGGAVFGIFKLLGVI